MLDEKATFLWLGLFAVILFVLLASAGFQDAESQRAR